MANDKIATAEEVQNEIKAIWAMTEEAEPSREKLAGALSALAVKVGYSVERETIDDCRGYCARIWKQLNSNLNLLQGIPGYFRGTMEGDPEFKKVEELAGQVPQHLTNAKKLIDSIQSVLHAWENRIQQSDK